MGLLHIQIHLASIPSPARMDFRNIYTLRYTLFLINLEVPTQHHAKFGTTLPIRIFNIFDAASFGLYGSIVIRQFMTHLALHSSVFLGNVLR